MNEHWALLPEPSVAVPITVVVPSGKVLPDAGAQLTLTEQLSVAPGVAKVATAPAVELAVTVWLAGHGPRTGGVSSTTMTVAVQELDSPCKSVAVRVTV